MRNSGLDLDHADLILLERAAATLCAPFAFGGVDGWRGAVNRCLSEIVHADLAIFYLEPSLTASTDSDGAPPIWSDELSSDEASDFVRYALHDAGTDRALAYGLLVATQRELVGDDWDVYYADPAVNDFYLPNRALDSIGLLSWSSEGRKQASVEMHRDVFGSTLFGQPGSAQLRILLPAFNAGVSALETISTAATSFAGVLDRLDIALALTDARGRIKHRTPALNRLLRADPAGEVLAAAIRSFAAEQAALFEARGWGRSHRTVGSALAGGQNATSTVRTNISRYRLTAVEAPEALSGGSFGFLIRIDAMDVSTSNPAEHWTRFGLTDREVQVARLLSAGASNARIAAALGISPHTARRHTERVLAKLNVRSRAGVGPTLNGGSTA